MPTKEPTPLKRAVTAIAIPYGDKVQLPEGSLVLVTQALGGNFTVLTEDGYLMQILGDDADALGLEREPEKKVAREGMSLEDQVWEELKTVYDPEIPVNIVELGLIYGVKVVPDVEGHSTVQVRMTMTAPGCGMGDILLAEIQRKCRALPGVDDVDVEIVLDPPWDPSMMSEAARLQTGML